MNIAETIARATGAEVIDAHAGGCFTYAATLPDGRHLVIGGEDGPLAAWDDAPARIGVDVYASREAAYDGAEGPFASFTCGATVADLRAALRAVPRYVVLYADGMTPIVYLQAAIPDPSAAVSEGLAARTLAEAVEIFRERIRATYRDGVATDDGGPWADVVSIGAWDGATYGQDTPAVRLTVGPRGGIRREHI